MNHADRQRLSQLLTYIADYDLMTKTGNGPLNANQVAERSAFLAEARAIVDAPTSPLDDFTFAPIRKHPLRETHPHLFTERHEPPNPKLDAFLTEPIHEYQPIEAYGLRINRGNHRAGRTRLATVAALALASIALTAATATQSAHPGPSHQPLPKPAANQPPRAAQHVFPATHIPYLPGHTPGTPGNGLGVAVTP